MAVADELRVAVASNFLTAAQALTQRFEQDHGHTVKLSFASTGKQFAQIWQGAPFDLFLAADVQRPLVLEQQRRIVPGTRFTYAIGNLVLWSPDPERVDAQGAVLGSADFRYLSMANPKLAPYGRAASELISALGLEGKLKGRTVYGESVGQALQFVHSGNAELGLVAHAQVMEAAGSLWVVPESYYAPIEQQAVQLSAVPAAAEFMAFLQSKPALEIIRRYGYRTR